MHERNLRARFLFYRPDKMSMGENTANGWNPRHASRADGGFRKRGQVCSQNTVIPCTRTGGVEATGKTVGGNGSESVPSSATFSV
jgi:hypothetical protein